MQKKNFISHAMVAIAVIIVAVWSLRPPRSFVQKSSVRFLISESAEYSVSSVSDYVYPEVGFEIWVGSIVAIIPIVWASYEFASRINTQKKCLVCNGSGLVYETRQGSKLSKPRKCWSCGGFLPWLGWKMFFFSSLVDPGNGGILQRPSADYQINNERILREKRNQAQDSTEDKKENDN